jgi:divalent metal cation (Fe/Co/Zn/Cd) transporter
VFVEDSAALIGIALALLGVAIGHWLDNPYIDPAASIAIGLLMLIAAAVLARETGALLVGEGVDGRYVEEFGRLLKDDPSVRWVGEILTMQLSPTDVLLTAEIGFDADLDTRGVVVAIERLKHHVRAGHPSVTRMYLEPRGVPARTPSAGIKHSSQLPRARD